MGSYTKYRDEELKKNHQLKEEYLAYHTMDTAQAIDRILEAKGLATDNEDEIKRQYEIFKKIRSKTQNKNNQKHKIKIVKKTKQTLT